MLDTILHNGDHRRKVFLRKSQEKNPSKSATYEKVLPACSCFQDGAPCRTCRAYEHLRASIRASLRMLEVGV